MGEFTRSGSFQNREKFLEALKARLEKMKSGALSGFTEKYSKEGEKDIATLQGMGATVRFEVAASSWECVATLPAWLPIPQSMVENMFDDAMKGIDDV